MAPITIKTIRNDCKPILGMETSLIYVRKKYKQKKNCIAPQETMISNNFSLYFLTI